MLVLGVVFVHGILSEPAMWDSFAELIDGDEDLKRADVRVLRFGYATGAVQVHPLRVLPSLDTVADSLKEFLATEAGGFERLVLVGHSQGGLVIQRCLVRMLAEGRGSELERIKRVVLLACPNTGSQFLLGLRRGLLQRNPQEKALRPFDEQLADTRRTLMRDIVHATEVSARSCPIPFSVYAGESDGVVTPASARDTFPDAAALPGDHTSIARPTSREHRTYTTVRRLILKALAEGDRGPSAGTEPIPASYLPFRDFTGRELPTGEPQGLGPTTVNVDGTLPPGTAELWVRQAFLDGHDGKVVFELAGYCCCGEDLAPTKNDHHGCPPRIALAALITADAGGESPTKSLYRMRNWSRSKVELLDWLARIRRRHGDDLRLIIWDDSGFDIPWELLWIGQDELTGQPGGWLGALATVTRWTTIQSTGGRVPYRSGRCEGEVVGYVAEEMGPDKELLHGTSPWLAATLLELLSELNRPGGDLALVYVACHGKFAQSSFEFTIDGISLGEIDSADLARIKSSGGLVFMNACHSGRLIEDQEYNDGVVRGFAEVFLRSGATGFIGTAGAVLQEQATTVAGHLLQAFRRDPGRPAPTVLRDYRRSVTVTDLPPISDLPAAKSLLPFINAYMYLFFGGPETSVALPGGDT